MLVLVCNVCRPKWKCHGEDENEEEKMPALYCNIDRCVHEGAAPQPVMIYGKEKIKLVSISEPEEQDDSICRA
jgi:hypothetical protein